MAERGGGGFGLKILEVGGWRSEVGKSMLAINTEWKSNGQQFPMLRYHAWGMATTIII